MTNRRTVLSGLTIGGVMASGAAAARAAEPATADPTSPDLTREERDRLRIVDVILRERHTRDLKLWDEMAACFNDDSLVDISWFKGSGAEFAKASSAFTADTGYFFHEVGHPFVRIRGARATAVTHTVVHNITELDGVGIDLTAHAQMYSRVANTTGRWLISGIRSVYVQDLITPLDPNRVPRLDEARLKTFRKSHRFLSYIQDQRGTKTQHDLAGIDRPDLVQALVAGEDAWLNGGA